MNYNTNKFDCAFDNWLDETPEYKAKHNIFTEIMGKMINNWPKIPKINL